MWEGRGSSVVGDRLRLDRNQICNDRIDNYSAPRERKSGVRSAGYRVQIRRCEALLCPRVGATERGLLATGSARRMGGTRRGWHRDGDNRGRCLCAGKTSVDVRATKGQRAPGDGRRASVEAGGEGESS